MRERREIGDILMTNNFFINNFLYALNFLRFCTLWVPDIYKPKDVVILVVTIASWKGGHAQSAWIVCKLSAFG